MPPTEPPVGGESANRCLFVHRPFTLFRALRDAPSPLPFRAVAKERTETLAASPELFQSGFLNYFSRVHPAIPALIFGPVVGLMIWLGADRGSSAASIALLVLGGVGIWTLTEYWLHRLVFHWQPDNAFGRRMHFIIHGVHHDHPNDKLRLVMPPAVSIPLAALFFLGFTTLFGTPAAYPLFAGFIAGYLAYDYTHYYVHHYVPKSEFARRNREQHMRHHFQDHRYGYGVSSPLWDLVFRTMPRRRHKVTPSSDITSRN